MVIYYGLLQDYLRKEDAWFFIIKELIVLSDIKILF